MSTQTLEPEVLVSGPPPVRTPGRLERMTALRPLSPVPTYVGISVAAVGFVLMSIAWGQVAGLANVALQMPYLISGGLVGLGLVQVGLVVVVLASKRRESLLREQQTGLLADALRELRRALDDER